MIIQMSNREFQEVREFISGMKNPAATKCFNEVFSKEPKGGVKGFVNPLNKDIVIEVPESLTYEVEKVLVKYSADIGKMSKGGISITHAPKYFNCIKSVFTEIAAAITHR